MFNTRGAEYVLDEHGNGLASDPQELNLSVVDKVEAVGEEALGGEVHGWGEDDFAGFGVGETASIVHVVERVEAWVNVLHEEGGGEGGEEAEGC